MVANHGVIKDILARVKHAQTVEHLEAYGGLVNRLLRAYALQTEAFAKLCRGGEQVVRVEHVHVHAGGQAIVGTVDQGGEIKKSQDKPKRLSMLWTREAIAERQMLRPGSRVRVTD